uniref:LOW QUALITY PROTEIN: dermatan-sulfate epimerase-like protein-like n=1 Tax=Saccoglossus kowalevskii TaxID=10224 RepID=A0ABM0MK66_SACKO|nr:PREDICTED: LOW QUALITY PROTEIN: dermatan-sulfate epimerase-like protein-like [Saccoglossus kowalevskii]
MKVSKVMWVLLLFVLITTCFCYQLQSPFSGHPMLYFGSEDVANLRRKAVTTHRHIAAVLSDAANSMLEKPDYYLPSTDYDVFAARWNEVYGNNLCALAFYCVLFPDDVKARKLAIQFMDNLVELPQWQVKEIPKDEVPVAHTFIGLTTAFDFLHEYLDEGRHERMLNRIKQETKEFDRFARIRSWGKFYLQNHVATNYLALIHGCLVVQQYDDAADKWMQEAVTKFERTMFLLNFIVDGSLDEGVAYGTYTSRSLTQYAFLSLRHWNIDHTKDFWFQQHFWFFYNTMLPGFQRNVAIADSNHNWFYGPESQLVFLDAFIMRNGYGNWLANEIRQHRPTVKELKHISASSSQKWCTIHTEFLWYDASIKPKPPPEYENGNLHTFTDWGVVTYSKISSQDDKETFLAFKSAKIHGRAIFDIVNSDRYKSWINGWSSFNPGHEHPDQNMFIFAPNGQLFISDALYGPKYTFLNNVLTFGPSELSECFEPWIGQLGECSKWLQWKKPEVGKSNGEVITATKVDEMVHMSGEAKNAYHSDLGLQSVYRNLILLNSKSLVVNDHIAVTSLSSVKHVSAFFHNTDVPFQSDSFGEKAQGAKITVNGEDYQMFWMKYGDLSEVPVKLPNVVVTSLPGAGAEIVSQMFYPNPDFVYLTVPSPAIRNVETELQMDGFVDACTWKDVNEPRFSRLSNWLRTLLENPATLTIEKTIESTDNDKNGNAKPVNDELNLSPLQPSDVNFKEYNDKMMLEHLEEHPHALPVLHLSSGTWPLKLPWLHRNLGDNLHSLYIICDPRLWISNILASSDSKSIYNHLNLQQYLQNMFEEIDKNTFCGPNNGYVWHFEQLRRILSNANPPPHRILAFLWLSHVQAVMDNIKTKTDREMIVKFENIINHPEETLKEVYKFLDMPVRPMVTHQLIQAAKTGAFAIPYLGVVNQDSTQLWKKHLSTDQIQDIEHICSSLMKQFKYKKWKQ